MNANDQPSAEAPEPGTSTDGVRTRIDRSLRTIWEDIRTAQRSAQPVVISNETLDRLASIAREARSSGYTYGVAEATRLEGVIAGMLDNRADAIGSLTRALELFEQEENIEGRARTLNSLGVLYSRQGDSRNALYHLLQASELEHLIADPELRIRLAGNLGHVHGALRDAERSSEYFRKALNEAEAAHSWRQAARYSLNLAFAFCDAERFDLAAEYLTRFEANVRKTGEEPAADLGTTLLRVRGRVLHNEGDFKGAVTAFRSAVAIADTSLVDARRGHEGIGPYQIFLEDLIALHMDLAGSLLAIGRPAAAAESMNCIAALFEQDRVALSEADPQRALELELLIASMHGQAAMHIDPSQGVEMLCAMIEKMEAENTVHLPSLYLHVAKAYDHLDQPREALYWQRRYDEAERASRARERATHMQAFTLRIDVERLVREKEALRHEAEKMRMRMEYQQRELASTAMSLARQTELLGRFRNDLRAIVHRNTDPAEGLKAVREKLKELPCEAIDWTRFDAEFRSTYPDFTSTLQTLCPSLSGMEVKVCSLLKLRLTSADMAKLLCLSERSIESHRLNIRKKLGLTRGQDLGEILAGI